MPQYDINIPDIQVKKIKRAIMRSTEAATQSHTHSNKTLLDSIDQSDFDTLYNNAQLLAERTFEPSYCTYLHNMELALTASFQTVTSFTSLSSTADISVTNGIFTCNTSGIYNFNLERQYLNRDKNPTNPVELTIQMIVNGSTVAIDRSAIISAATANNEPGLATFNTNRIISVSSRDTFRFQVKAEESGINPSDTVLSIMEVTANKIYN